jgi:signal recognition particle GTPase
VQPIGAADLAGDAQRVVILFGDADRFDPAAVREAEEVFPGAVMFESLSDKLESVFKKLRGHGKLDEKNIEEGLKEVRMALLEADVHFRVVKRFIDDIRSRAMGREVMSSLTPGQQVVKIVNEVLTELMGAGTRS